MKKSICTLFFLLVTCFTIHAQDSLWVRKYKASAFNQYDLRNSSINFITANRALNDAFRKNIKPLMGEKIGNISYGIYSFAVTYLTMLWSHEIGHSLRARQANGQFKIHDMALPVPNTTMHLPDDITLMDEALSVTAGFEVNYISVRDIQNDFITQNGLYNEDLALSFAHRVLYPLYISLITPMDASNSDAWTDPAGDPAFIALLVSQNYSEDPMIMPDGTVNPDLVDLYNQSAIFASFFSLLDPQFYREVGGAFGKNKTRKPIFLLGDQANGWTYGTLFNTSPLGYELYMNNYIHFNDKQFTVYLKYGNPFKNNGIGVLWNNMISNESFNVAGKLEAWDQDIFGKGMSGEVTMDWKFSDRFGASITTGYKTEGYVLGKQIAEGFNLGMGLVYYAKY